MLYNEHNLAVAKIASKSGILEEITGVYFTKDKTVATDRYRLLEITTPANMKPEDFPLVSGASAMRGVSPFLARAKSLSEIKLPKKPSLPILSNFAIKHLDKESVQFLTTDLETAQVHSVYRLAGKFPDYEQIFPTGEPVVELVINGEMLAELLEIISKLDHQSAVKFKIYGKELPVVVEAGNADQKGRGMIMPIKQ